MYNPPSSNNCWFDTGANHLDCPPNLLDWLTPIALIIAFVLLGYVLIMGLRWYFRKRGEKLRKKLSF